MSENPGTAVTTRKSAEVATQATPLTISPEYVQQQRRSLALLQTMVRDVLVRGRDYGSVPGVPSDFLWDPGASQIIASFSCHVGERRLKSLVDDGEKIAVIIEVPLLSFSTGNEVGSGIGAASTLETKNKYRWVENPKEWGYNDEALKTVKSELRDGKTKWRIPNPEHDDLLNTIIKMASKRAEVDAATGLPGVSAALRELFEKKGTAGKKSEDDWSTIWSKLKQLGMSDEDVDGIFGDSLKEWVAQGHTKADILPTAEKWLTKNRPPKEAPKAPPASQAEPPAPGNTGKAKRDPESLKSLVDLFNAAIKDWPQAYKTKADILKDLGFETQEDISITPPQCYRMLIAVRG